MDRREALKKLTVGGALAAGGSIVLSSNVVAFAQSGGPAAASDFGVDVQTNASGVGTIQLNAPPAPQGATGATYDWQILGCSVPQGRTLVLINSNSSGGQIIARANRGSCSPIAVTTGPLSNVPAVLVRTVAGGGSSNPKELEPGNTVSLRLVVNWFVGGNNVEGRYDIGGTFPNIQVTPA